VTEFADQPVLGIDPGLNITGYAVVDVAGRRTTIREAGIVRSVRGASMPARLAEIFDGISDVIQAFHPAAVSLEELFSHYKRPRTAILMGHARGVICLAAMKSNTPVFSYAATKVKKLLTGSGRASKQQIQQAVMREFGLTVAPEPPDVADAIAIALCHVHYQQKAKIT
jgi:crossover junction endodeoxyribonuclease RuvC